MSAEPFTPDPDGLYSDARTEAGLRALKDALAAAERLIRPHVETIKEQTRAYAGPAGKSVEEARRYVVERVKERPVTATMAGLGVGILLGLLLSSRGK